MKMNRILIMAAVVFLCGCLSNTEPNTQSAMPGSETELNLQGGWTIPQLVYKVKQRFLNNNHWAKDSQAPNGSVRGYNNLQHKKIQPALRHRQNTFRSVFPPLLLMF